MHQVIHSVLNHSQSLSSLTFAGKQPCLLCHITLDELRNPSTRKGPCTPRTLDTILLDHQNFMDVGGDIKRAKEYNNCIQDPFFNIPLSQVNVYDCIIII